MKLKLLTVILLIANVGLVGCTASKKPGDLDASYYDNPPTQPSGAQTAASMIRPLT